MARNIVASTLDHILNDRSTNMRTKVFGIYTFLIAFNIVVWICAIIGLAPYPELLGTAVLA
ncbi:MAG TPA: hypothetical protein VL461_15745, partial [Dictyobacter sp.]|nr:hypothetical protein [Dictyobacter sp.]